MSLFYTTRKETTADCGSSVNCYKPVLMSMLLIVLANNLITLCSIWPGKLHSDIVYCGWNHRERTFLDAQSSLFTCSFLFCYVSCIAFF